MNKTKFFIIGIFCAVLLSVFLYFPDYGKQTDPSVALVNNEGISLKMFMRQVSKNRALIYSRFSQKYNITDQAAFWNTTFDDNQIPSEVLKRESLNACTKIKIQQILAKSKGMVNDISYDEFLRKLDSVNRERKLAAAEKKVIYGPVEFTETAYFDHLLSLLVIETKEKLAQSDLDLSEESLHNYYESKKEKIYKEHDSGSSIRYIPYQNIKTLVRSNYIDDQYEKLIYQMIGTAKVIINYDVYNNIIIE